MALVRGPVELELQVLLEEVVGGEDWPPAEGATGCSPAVAAPTPPSVAPEVASPADRRKGPVEPTNRRASLRASRRARRTPAAPTPTLTAPCPTPLAQEVAQLAYLVAQYLSSDCSPKFKPPSAMFSDDFLLTARLIFVLTN